MAQGDPLPPRKLDLVIGHVVFAPVAGVFFAAIAGFTFARLAPLVGGSWNGPSSVTWVATIFGYFGGNLFVFGPIGILLSLAVAHAIWNRRPWADRLAATLAVTSWAVFLNSLLWGAGNATPHLGAIVLRVTLTGLAWFAYVLLRLREAWRPAHPVDRASAIRARLVAAGMIACAVAAWQWPLHYLRERAAAVDAHWNGSKAYACANVITSEAVATVGEAAWQRLGIYDLPGNGVGSRQYVLVAEIGPESFVRHVVPEPVPLAAANTARCLVHDGTLHLVFSPNGGQEDWRAARWEGSRFVPLGAAESDWVRGAVARFNGSAGNTADAEWVSDGFHTGEVAFTLGETPIKIRYDADAPAHYRLSTTPPRDVETLFLTMGRSAEVPLVRIHKAATYRGVQQDRWSSRGAAE